MRSEISWAMKVYLKRRAMISPKMIGVDMDTQSPRYRLVQFTSASVSLKQVISGNEIPIYGQLLTSVTPNF